MNWPAPSCVSQFRSRLGTFGFWRAYIHHYADITAPLIHLTCKIVAWQWSDVEQLAPENLKAAISDSCILAHPNVDTPFFVITDASNIAIGASLDQEEDGKRRPVAFLSPSLNAAERNYPGHERELLAIVLTLRTWRRFVHSSIFKVLCQTDHRPLQHFTTQDTLSARQVRWQQCLSDYNLSIFYVPGSVNNFADGLSRRPGLRLVTSAAAPYPWLSKIKEAFKHDAEAVKLYNRALQKPISYSYRIVAGILYHVYGEHRVYVRNDHTFVGFS
jgi:hypothetical protein